MNYLVSERGINLHFYPVVKSKSKKLDEDYIKRRNNKITFISKKGCMWDYNCYCLMDYFASEYKNSFDKHSVINGSGLIIDYYDSRLDEFLFINRPDFIVDLQRELENPGYYPSLRDIYCKNFSRRTKEMTKHPSLNHMSGKILKSTIEKASSFMVKTKYAFLAEGKIRDNGGFLKRDYSNTFDGIAGSEFYNLFNFESKPLKIGKDKKSYNIEYNFSFNTILGALFFHNISCKSYNLINDSLTFYNISKNANLLYRKRFMGLKDISTFLRMDTVLSDLGLFNSNFSESKKKFISIVEELADNKLIFIKKFKSDGNILRYRAIAPKKNLNKSNIIKLQQKIK
jgi:hypothetical protein